MIYEGSNQRVPEYHSWMCICAGLGIDSYVELGCGSASWLQRIGVQRIVTVDMLPNGLANTGIPHVQGNSHDPATVDRVLSILGRKPDVVFIDADHESLAVLEDFALWYPVARVAVGFHDVRMASVAPAWGTISLHHPSIEIVARDLASADAWQRGGHHPDGDVHVGGIGVVFKELEKI